MAKTRTLKAATVAVAMLGAAALLAATSPSVAQDAKATAASAGGDDAKLKKGHDLFDNYACGSCHSLAAAGAAGHVGPAFDGDNNLSQAFVVGRITNGQGAMPSFSGQMSAEEIDAVAAYIVRAAAK
jgi:mono/diheme cytochrome c family protein